MAKQMAEQIHNGAFADWTDSDEYMASGGINFDEVDDPSAWDVVTDKQNKKIKKAVRLRRLLTPPFVSQEVWMPVLKKNEHNEYVLGFSIFRRKPKSKGGLLDQMYNVERALNPDKEIKDLQLSFSTRYWYLGFCREDEKEDGSGLKVRWLKYGSQIKNEVRTIQHEESPRVPGKLLRGPSILYDVIITKTIDESVSGLGQTKYTVSADPENIAWVNKVPISFWQTGFAPDFDFKKYKILTEEEMDAIADFQRDNEGLMLNQVARQYLKPHEELEIFDSLKRFPINQYAKKNNVFVFGDPDAFRHGVSEIDPGLKLLEDTSLLPKEEESETPPPPPDYETESAFGEQEPPEMAEASVVDDETSFPPKEDVPSNPFVDPEPPGVQNNNSAKTDNAPIMDEDISEPWPEE